MEHASKIMDELSMIPADEIHLAGMDRFADFFQALRKVKETEKIKNSSLAMLNLLELAAKSWTIPKKQEEPC